MPAVAAGVGAPTGPAHPNTYPLPQKPTYRENTTNIPMHQPRPQKQVSVAGIESPASMTFHAPPQQEQQPFHQQVPVHMNGQQPAGDQSAYYSHARQMSYPSQASGGTPLSNIPERAIHAQPFQPYQQAGFQPQVYGAQPAFYYPQPGVQPQYPPGTVIAPMFIPNGQQGTYVVPTVAPPIAPPAAQVQAAPTQGNMMAQEVNGMVYYYDPNQVYQSADNYSQPGYTMPGMGGMMTPTPDGYYYPQMPSGTVYYPSQ